MGSDAKYGTSCISHHMLKGKAFERLKQIKLPKIMINNLGKLRCRKIHQTIFKSKIALAIIKHDFHFSFVEYDAIRDVLKYLNPNVKLISRNTIAFDVFKVCSNEKEGLKDELAKFSIRICLTPDLWTSCT